MSHRVPPPPPTKHNHDVFHWFRREISLEILQQEPVGSFLVRHSTSKPGCYALSLRVPKDYQATAIAHYLIVQTNRGFKIKVNFLSTVKLFHRRSTRFQANRFTMILLMIYCILPRDVSSILASLSKCL